jgi:predicted SprT family Zn-dependent metalloprotease
MWQLYKRELYTDEEWAEMTERFADPGGDSALYPETQSNPRNLPCPTCQEPGRLTARDKAKGYQCDACADRAERGLDGY